MKIGIDGRLWHESGVGRYIRNLVKELSIIDNKNTYVLFLRNIKEIRPYKLPKNWKLREANIRWHTVGEQIKFLSILNQERLDLMHFPYFSVPIFYNRPFIVTIHDLILHHFPTGEASTLPWPVYQIKLLGYKLVIKQAVKKAQKIITVSNATKQEIIDHLGVDEDKIVVTYEGIDRQIAYGTSHVENNHKLRAISHKPYFLYVGNAYPHKNLEKLIQAFSMMNDKGLMINLIMVGKEDYFYKKLKEKVKKVGLIKHVLFYGDANDEELASLYKNAKALVLPSLMEGFGLPALEAMANGCLVLASDIPALREICGNSAIYFNPYDSNEIKKKLEYILNHDRDYFNKQVGEGIKVTKMFSWEKMAEETLKAYESCIGV